MPKRKPQRRQSHQAPAQHHDKAATPSRPQGDNDVVNQIVSAVQSDMDNPMFMKAMGMGPTTSVTVPSKKGRGQSGMQSVEVDRWSVNISGDFIEPPHGLSFETMRQMAYGTPPLAAAIMTRQRQVQRFCRIQDNGVGPGFVIRHRDRNHELTEKEMKELQALQSFFSNCGWEDDPRKRKSLKRDSFSQFMSKLTADTLILDAATIETEWKRDKGLGVDGMYAVDGASIRLCTELGYEGDDEIYALQVVNGQVRTIYTAYDLIYEPRNARTDLTCAGYGMSEVALMVRLVTGYLNAMQANTSYFDNNTLPRGVMHLVGNYSKEDLAAFKRYWNSMTKGPEKMWGMPVMASESTDAKASFEKFDIDMNEMAFAKWMSFLTAIICAIFGMSPEEINAESFSAGNTSTLSGNDTSEKLASSADKGLRPLLSYFENLLTDYIVRTFSDKYEFRFTGLDDDDADRRWEAAKLTATWNELRADQGRDAIEGPLGDMPVNRDFIPAWQAMLAQGEPDENIGMGADDDGDFGDDDFGDDDADADNLSKSFAASAVGRPIVYGIEP